MEKTTIENRQGADEISLKDIILKFRNYYRYLLSRWGTLLIFGVIGGALGLTYSLLKKPVYTASTTFVLEESDKGGGLGQYAGLASMVGVDLGGGGAGGIFQGDNILELYKSRKMIQKTLLTEVTDNGKKMLLIDRYITFNHLREKWEDPELKKIKFTGADSVVGEMATSKYKRLQDSVLGTIVFAINKNNLTVAKPDKKLNIIKAEVEAKDEFFAKSFDQQIVKNVNDFYIQTKTKKAMENVAILQKKTDSVRAVMNGAIYSAVSVTDATPNLNVTRQIQRMAPVQRSQFNAETNKAVLEELVKNLELSKVNLLKETPLIQVIDQPVLPLEKAKMGKVVAILIGVILSVFLTAMVLLVKRIWKSVMA